ncbi:hypothetical protein ACF1GZ_15300 [Streptomyces albidoflavus]
MIERLCENYADDEVNLVFVRGMPLTWLVAGLVRSHRMVVAGREEAGWAWVVHLMHDAEEEDYAPVDYRPLCPAGTELVVFETEPCRGKAHGPAFTYYRDGRTVVHFSFEDLRQRVGDDPDHLSPELLAAGLIGPGTPCPPAGEGGHLCWEHSDADELRLLRTLAAHFALPSPPFTPEVTHP